MLICLPTPLNANREPDLGPLRGATAILAQVPRAGQLVCLESTTYPGTTREQLAPLLEAGGVRAGVDFHLAFSPERVDPGRTDYTLEQHTEGRRRADGRLRPIVLEALYEPGARHASCGSPRPKWPR